MENEIWKFSITTAEGETAIGGGIASTLADPVDIAVGASGIFIADPEKGLFKFETDNTLTALDTGIKNPAGITVDSLTGDLIVLDIFTDSILRLDSDSLETTTMFSGFGNFKTGSWAGLRRKSISIA